MSRNGGKDGSESTPLPRIVLEPQQGLPSADFWRALASPFANLRFSGDPSAFSYRSEFLNVDGIVFSQSRFSDCEVVPHADSWRVAEETLLLQVFHEAVVESEVGDIKAEYGPDRVILED